MKKKELVIQSNPLVEAQYKLSPLAQQLVRKVISMIKTSPLTDFKKNYYRLSVRELAEFTGRKINSLYTDIKQVSDQLLKTILIIEKGESYIKTTWFASIEYHDGEGWLEFEFSTKLESELLKLKKSFTAYHLKNIASLSSQYSIRIYELLQQYSSIGKRFFDLNRLRLLLGIKPNQYKRFNDFKRYVLNKAEKELLNKTNISFVCLPHKTGRKITGLLFKIFLKKQVETCGKEYQSMQDYSLWDLLPKIHIISDSIRNIILKACDEKGINYVKEKIEYVNSMKPNNYLAYLKNVLKNGYGDTFDSKATKHNSAKKESRDCFNRCKGNCGGSWENYKNNKKSACYWCPKFNKL